MHRTPWEMERHLRYRLADIDADRARTVKLPGAYPRHGERLSRLKRDLGLRLIAVGKRLAGPEPGRLPLPTPPADLKRTTV